MEKIKKAMTTIDAIIGCLMTRYIIPTTETSSVTLATEFVIGSGEVLIAARIIVGLAHLWASPFKCYI